MFKRDCNCILILSIAAVLGIIVGVVAFNVAIPGIIIAISVTLALTALILLLLTILVVKVKEYECLCDYSKGLALGIIGTVITAVIALSVTIVTASVGIAILLGLLTAFGLTTLLSFIGLILCIINKNCYKCDCMN